MSIVSIKISNFKSIDNIYLSFNKGENIHCLLGKNGVGKTNVFAAINYFYENLCDTQIHDVVDVLNGYNSVCEISITYDLTCFEHKMNSEFLEKCFETIRKEANEYKCKLKCKNTKIGSIRLTLKQDKLGNIKWNQKIEVRKIIGKLYPLYVINTRKLDLGTWDKLWSTINDLNSDVPKVRDDEANEILDEAFSKIYSKYESRRRFVDDLFHENGIALDKYHNVQRFKYMFMTRYGGDVFLNDGRNLDYYSDGINSFLYIKLLFSTICKISSLSCKNPLILLDEPEIGLHEAKIEELIAKICEVVNKDVFVMMNTHSPKIVLELITNNQDINIYRLFLKRQHTSIRQLDVNWLRSLKHIITTKETSCYFSDYLLFVEGESEYQVFCSKELKKLFPFLKKIHVYPYLSNNAIIKYVCPFYINIGIPYTTLLDIDKVLLFSRSKGNSYYVVQRKNEELNPLKNEKIIRKNKMKFFSGKNDDFYDEFEGLLKMKFSYKSGCNYVDDPFFTQLINTTKKLCKANNVCVNSSTIEGLLVNYANVDLFLDFWEEKYGDEHNSVIKKIRNCPDVKEKTVLIRLCLDGKLDLFDKEIVATTVINQKNLLVSSKADGWIVCWIEWFFSKKCNCAIEEAEKEFKKYFPELYDSLQTIKYMI